MNVVNTTLDIHFVCSSFSVLLRMYYHFRPMYWYWIVVVLARKLLIAITALMFAKNPGFQMAIALLVLFICYALQVRNTPYMSMSEREEV